MKLFDLSGKTAVITGSSKGIGKAIAEQMADHGANVVISSRKAGPCDEVAQAINAKHGEGRAIAVPANISVLNTYGQAGTIVTFPDPVAADNVPGVTAGCNPPSGTFFPIGTTTVTCSATGR